MAMEPIERIVNQIFDLYDKQGASAYAGEKVSQLEHMCQAAMFALEENYDDEVVLAAFMHDLGHLLPAQQETMGEYGTIDHEKIGADHLHNLGFSDRLCRLIASHVNAKRYLTWKDPMYYEQLSEASKITLEYQGGRMNAVEAAGFEEDPLFELYIKMRQWDEAAKVEHQRVPDIKLFHMKAVAHLQKQRVTEHL
jgi:phosphonate degradation associated HDIG domain protein